MNVPIIMDITFVYRFLYIEDFSVTMSIIHKILRPFSLILLPYIPSDVQVHELICYSDMELKVWSNPKTYKKKS